MQGNSAGSAIGDVQVTYVENGGLPPEYYAKRAADRMLVIGKNAPPLILKQAQDFKEDIEDEVLKQINFAIESDRASICYKLESEGRKDIADIIRRL